MNIINKWRNGSIMRGIKGSNNEVRGITRRYIRMYSIVSIGDSLNQHEIYSNDLN